GSRRPSARRYLLRRALRILPLYYVAIALVWTTRYTGQPEARVDLLEHLTLTQAASRAHIFWTIGPAWSLSVEAGFYLLLPLVALLAAALSALARGRFLRAAIVAIGPLVLLVGSLAWKAWALDVLHAPFDDWPVWFGLGAKLDTFAIGMLLAVVRAAFPRARLPAATCWAARGLG